MERVRFIDHRGHRVLLLDYTNLADEPEILEMIEERRELVSKEPPGSVLTLTDLSGAHVSRTVIQRLKEVNVLEKPFVRRAAAVGAESLTPKGAAEAIATFAAKRWGRFATREEALDWLVEPAVNSAAS